MDDFTVEKTKHTILSLSKRNLPEYEEIFEDGVCDDFVQMDVNMAAQGFGRADNELLQRVRMHCFVGDKLYVLIRRKNDLSKYELYYLFYKNSSFYSVNHYPAPSYVMNFYKPDPNNPDEPPRKGQEKWREQLSEFAMALNVENPQLVICPFTSIKVEYKKVGTLLRASHIKAYKDCKLSNGEVDINEAFDIDNGFLIVANADALFDKYLISVNPQTLKIEYSPKISEYLKSKLAFNEYIDEIYVNENKKHYLEEHYKKFKSKNFK